MKLNNVITYNDFFIEDMLEIENSNPINEIISVVIDPIVEDFEIIDIKDGRTIKGEFFEGKRIVLFVSLKIHLKYTSYDSGRIFFEDRENKRFLYINCPKKIDQTNIEELKRKRKIKIQIITDKVSSRKIDEKIVLFKSLIKSKIVKI